RFERSLRCGAGRDLFRCCGKLLLDRTHSGGEPVFRQLAANTALEFGAASRRLSVETIIPGLVRGLARKSCAAPHLTHLGGNGEGVLRPTESFPRAPDFIGAERRTVGLLRPCLARRAEADDGAAGDERGPVARLRLLQRFGDRLGIVPVDACRRPAGGLEALDL